MLYCWRNPHEIELEMLRTYVVTIVLFRIALLPTALIAIAAIVFLVYALIDFAQEVLFLPVERYLTRRR